MKAADIYQQVTDDMISRLENGLANPDGWVKPWVADGCAPMFTNKNLVTQQRYKGINQLILWLVAQESGYVADEWVTFIQAKNTGRRLIDAKGKGVHLMKWTPLGDRCKDHPGISCSCGFMTGFVVFNIELLEGHVKQLPQPIEMPSWERVARADALVAGTAGDGLTITYKRIDRAFYDRSIDAITLPEIQQFVDAEGYYATLLHEMSHSTGHENRCGRELHLAKRFGDKHYAMEELVAELASAFLSAYTQIPDSNRTEQHGNYLANWLDVLKADPKALAHCAAKAQEAADYWIKKAVLPTEALELLEEVSA